MKLGDFFYFGFHDLTDHLPRFDKLFRVLYNVLFTLHTSNKKEVVLFIAINKIKFCMNIDDSGHVKRIEGDNETILHFFLFLLIPSH